VLSWLIWIPLALSHFGIGPFHIAEETSSVVRLLGVLMPATAALLLTSGMAGKAGVHKLLGRLAIWRGLALPALEIRHSAFVASLVLAGVWATWHIPFWLLLDTFDQFGLSYLVLNYLLVFPMTFHITWFFNHGSSSVLLAVAFHLSFNIVITALLPVTINLGAFGLLIAAEWLIALLILPYLGPSGAAKRPGRRPGPAQTPAA